jgi:hypothetical protein
VDFGASLEYDIAYKLKEGKNEDLLKELKNKISYRNI